MFRRFPPKVSSHYPRTPSTPQLLRISSKNVAGNTKQHARPAEMLSQLTAYDGSTINADDLPVDVMRRRSNFSTLHLFDRDVSKAFASLVIDEVPKEGTFIAEMNPGAGLMTHQLLESGVSVVHSYEKFPEFMKWLYPLSQKYSGRLQIRPYNFASLGKAEFLDRQVNSRIMKNMFEGLKPRDWQDRPAIAVVGAVPSVKFFYSLQWTLMNQYLSDYGRIVLYVAVSPSVSLVFADDPSNRHFHRPKNVFLRTFFDFKKLGTLPRNAFFPAHTDRISRKRFREYYMKDYEVMDVVKIEAKKDFFTENFTRHHAIVFYYFLAIHMRKKNTRIIPVFEKWIPGCGPRLIQKDYNIYSTFDALPADELLQLFKIFISWPDYDNSPFTNFVETLMLNKTSEE
ncbi:dimethyladenosine transferase 2, mitochondrial [Diachasmimorpha longicaudata]|uniref:dimethyladenosine transferase 2, mitochondrial n=1 Tax=Diachasmimorpha longicaudata TaxID=58733 RepID=UPI0030B8DDF9